MQITTKSKSRQTGEHRSEFFKLDWESLKQAREYVPTFITEFTVMLSLLLSYKLAAHNLGREGFSEYAVARRTISFLYPFLLLGLANGLPRYIAYGNGDPNRSNRYYGAALRWLASAAAVSSGLIVFFKREFAYLFFGASLYNNLVLPLGLVIIALSLHTVIYAYFRGNLEFKKSNLLQLVNFALVPIIVFSVFGTSVQSVLTAWGVLTSAVAMTAMLLTPWRKAVTSKSWVEARELLAFGVRRIPGDFASLGLMALPATFSVHLYGVEQGGFIAFGTSLTSMILSLFTPVGIVLLPKASQMLAGDAHEALREHVWRLVKLTVVVSLGLTFAFEMFAGPLVRLYLGNEFSRIEVIVRIYCLTALPLALVYVLRGLIDAYHTRAVNAANCACGLTVFLLCCALSLVYPSPKIIPWAFVAGVFTLGFLTVREARRILKDRPLPAPNELSSREDVADRSQQTEEVEQC